jgi:hypothetical protein
MFEGSVNKFGTSLSIRYFLYKGGNLYRIDGEFQHKESVVQTRIALNNSELDLLYMAYGDNIIEIIENDYKLGVIACKGRR